MNRINIKDKPASDNHLKALYTQMFSAPEKAESVLLLTVPVSGVDSMFKYAIGAKEIIKRDYEIDIENLDIEIFDFSEEFIERIHKESSERSQFKFIYIPKIDHYLQSNEDILIKLKRLYDSRMVRFIISFYSEPTPEVLQKILNITTTLNIQYVAKRNDEDIMTLLDKEEKWFEYKIPSETKQRIISLSGGHPATARVLLSIANDTNQESFLKRSENDLINDSTLRPILEHLHQGISQESRLQIYRSILKKGVYKEEFSEYIVKTGYVDKKHKLYSSLLNKYFEYKMQEDPSFIETDNGLTRFGLPLNKILSNQEILVFRGFYKNQGVLITREEIAKIMWGKEWSEQYSDWAIDGVIHNLRKKLRLNKSTLENKKGKGVILNI